MIDTLINKTIDNITIIEENKAKLSSLTSAEYWEGKIQEFIDFIPTLIVAILVLFIGIKLVSVVLGFFVRFGHRKGWDSAVINFLRSVFDVILKFLVILTAIQILGFNATSLLAMFGACGLAIGLALQGTLQNFAGGVVILVLKPFKLGDILQFGEHKGVVREIKIFNTVIEKALTNELVIIPNSAISSNTLINWTAESDRRVDAQFSVAYGEDIDHVRRVVLNVANNDPRLLAEVHPPEVVVTALADSSVNLELRVWVAPEDYFNVMADMLERIYKELNANNISIPFPQLDVNLKK